MASMCLSEQVDTHKLDDNNQFLRYNTKFEQKNFALSSNGYNFSLVVRRSIREFMEHDEQDGFYLSRYFFRFQNKELMFYFRLFSEAHRLWLIIIDTNKSMGKSSKVENIHMR